MSFLHNLSKPKINKNSRQLKFTTRRVEIHRSRKKDEVLMKILLKENRAKEEKVVKTRNLFV